MNYNYPRHTQMMSYALSRVMCYDICANTYACPLMVVLVGADGGQKIAPFVGIQNENRRPGLPAVAEGDKSADRTVDLNAVTSVRTARAGPDPVVGRERGVSHVEHMIPAHGPPWVCL